MRTGARSRPDLTRKGEHRAHPPHLPSVAKSANAAIGLPGLEARAAVRASHRPPGSAVKKDDELSPPHAIQRIYAEAA